MPRPTISYSRIARAIAHYDHLEYQYLEVPWAVSKEAIDVTRPPNAPYFDTPCGHLVASGEQSFLEIRDQLLPNHKYQCATPCFRVEKYDSLHLPYFFKVELIIVLLNKDDAQEYTHQIIRDAMSFLGGYRTVGRGGITYGIPKLVPTDIGTDIEIEGIEVGSYGYREHQGFHWVYGTGIAEPRLGQAIDAIHLKNERNKL